MYSPLLRISYVVGGSVVLFPCTTWRDDHDIAFNTNNNTSNVVNRMSCARKFIKVIFSSKTVKIENTKRIKCF